MKNLKCFGLVCADVGRDDGIVRPAPRTCSPILVLKIPSRLTARPFVGFWEGFSGGAGASASTSTARPARVRSTWT